MAKKKKSAKKHRAKKPRGSRPHGAPKKLATSKPAGVSARAEDPRIRRLWKKANDAPPTDVLSMLWERDGQPDVERRRKISRKRYPDIPGGYWGEMHMPAIAFWEISRTGNAKYSLDIRVVVGAFGCGPDELADAFPAEQLRSAAQAILDEGTNASTISVSVENDVPGGDAECSLYVEDYDDLLAASLSPPPREEDADKITTLPVAKARSLAKQEGYLALDELTTLSADAASELSQHEGDLSLGSLTTLSDEAATSLGRHKGDLRLYSVTKLSDEAARALAKCKGGLWLGLTTLSDEAAKALAKRKARVFLSSLTTLSDTAAKALAQHEGELDLGVTTLSDEAAKSLAKHKGWLYLTRLTTLSDEAAKALRANGEVSLPQLRSASPAAKTKASKKVTRKKKGHG